MNLCCTQALQYILFAVHVLSGNYYNLCVQKHKTEEKESQMNFSYFYIGVF